MIDFRLLKILLTLTALMLIWGCGSGGGTSTDAQVVSKTTLAGPVNPGVKGIDVTLVLPATVTPVIDPATGKPAVTLLSPNDVDTLLEVIYTAASGTNPGKVRIIVIRGNIPFSQGDFFSVPCEVEAGKPVPAASEFTSVDLKIWDSNGADITTTTSGTTILL